ncbi:GAF and ANTAR domain-containing protein [Amycolatopsis sp. H20-H5]|uniref:GAF and ANTAR domain-containing protein n=1 Tax=Amycolatopsis sp. H20-H5 TaxID=3046309 RepID=UPI002DBE249C|nr:GAF and ANTAR domain-containing protein [Amycolatopsis sp. H20-H5]MEC3974171.1 GAF and ANTAR domain-containing protein [Amycolatopsis sp. H20-H5]
MARQRDDAADSIGIGAVVRQVDEVTGALEGLSGALAQEEQLQTVLQRVCHQVVRAIGEADLASVTLLRDGEPYTAAVAGDEAVDVDEAQYAAGEGPCLHAATTGQVTRATVAIAVERWPVFSAKTAGNGLDSYLSAPLFINSEYHGSLNLYGRGSDGFDALDAALLELYTTAVEAALRNAQLYLQARDQATQLSGALSTRAVIDQAKGILMAVHRIPSDEAFTMLVEQSQARNVKVRDIAASFVNDIVDSNA